MKFTHNSNNDWRDEAKYLGVDKDLFPWIQAIEKAAEKRGSSKSEDSIEKKLKDAYVCCSKCGNKYGEHKGMSTYYIGICDVCGIEAIVTEARDYGYFKKTLNY